MQRSLVRVIALLAVLALAAPMAVEAQGKGTIKIATQSPLSGELAALGEGIKLGTQLAVEKFKGAVEKAGFKVELVPFDDQAKPDVGVANARLVGSGHLRSVVAIARPEVCTGVSLAVIPLANTGPLITDRMLPSVDRVCGRDDVQGAVAAEFAIDALKAKSVYIVHNKN